MMCIHIKKKSVADPCNPQGFKPVKVLGFCGFFYSQLCVMTRTVNIPNTVMSGNPTHPLSNKPIKRKLVSIKTLVSYNSFYFNPSIICCSFRQISP